MLDAVDYQLVVNVYYLDAERNHTEVVYNATVTVTEPEEQLLNTETAFLMLGGTALIGFIIYYVMGSVAKGKPKAAKNADGSRVADESWLENTTIGKKKKTSKKKKK